MSNKQYSKRNAIELDSAGGYYTRHVSAMTGEALHRKADIAAELAWRDMEIDRLRAARDEPVAADSMGAEEEDFGRVRQHIEPRLVGLICGLRRHQVEEAVNLLLDYVDASRLQAKE